MVRGGTYFTFNYFKTTGNDLNDIYRREKMGLGRMALLWLIGVPLSVIIILKLLGMI